MKNLTIVLFTFCTLALNAKAYENSFNNSKNFEILKDLKEQVKKCVSMNITANSDHQTLRSFESLCTEVRLISTQQAEVLIENNWYTATIIESPEADDGDLDNMELRDSHGQLVAVRNNVPAFDFIVLAMTGGDQKLQTRRTP